MADYWTAPKTNWAASDGIGYEDLNRIGANISANRDGNFRKVQGFGYTVDNSVVGQDGVVTILPGSCYSNNGFPIRMNANHVKNLTTWAAGNGPTVGGMAAAVTVAARTWYYAFVIMNPNDGSTEIMFDDNISGSNVSSGIYTEKRFIQSFKTGAAGGDGSFDLIEMYAIGDQVHINPDSMYTAARGIVPAGLLSDSYTGVTLTDGAAGFALPARDVRANLNVNIDAGGFGLISSYGLHFTVPGSFIVSGIERGEFVHINPTAGGSKTSGDCDIMVPSTRTLYVGVELSGSGLRIAVRGYHDERLL